MNIERTPLSNEEFNNKLAKALYENAGEVAVQQALFDEGVYFELLNQSVARSREIETEAACED